MRDLAQHHVAGRMAVFVVDRLEAVQIEHQHRATRVAQRAGCQRGPHPLRQQAPVRQPGELIVTRVVLRMRFAPPDLVDVGQRNHVFATTDRAQRQLAPQELLRLCARTDPPQADLARDRVVRDRRPLGRAGHFAPLGAFGKKVRHRYRRQLVRAHPQQLQERVVAAGHRPALDDRNGLAR